MYLDSQRIMLNYDIDYVDVENEMGLKIKREFKNCFFFKYFFELGYFS